MRKYLLIIAILFLSALPSMALAQTPREEQEIDYVEPSNPEPLPSRYPTPFFGLAQPVTQNSTSYDKCYTDMEDLGDIICRIGELLNAAIPILIALAVVYFVWGVVQYVIGDSEEAKTKGKDRIIYGIIGFAIIIGLWGLVALVVNTFGVAQGAPDINLTNFRFQDGSTTENAGVGCSIGSNPKLQNLLGFATCIITKSVIPLMFTFAVAAFVWGVVQFLLLGGDSDEKRAQGKQFMLWGIIALTVMVCVWGLVAIVARTFNVDNVIPQVKGK